MRKPMALRCMGWVVLWVAAWPAATPAQKMLKTPADDPPRINMTVWYEVDPTWPERPAGVEWGQTSGVAVDAKDQVYVFTRAKPPVQVYSTQGKFLRAWGEDLIETAHYIRVAPDGTIWAADVGKHAVFQFTPDGKLLRTLGTPGEPGEDATHLNRPTDMAILPSGDVFVTDGYGNSRIVHFDAKGRFVKSWGTLGTQPGQFSLPHSIVADSQGRLYVADRSNVRIQVFDKQGRFLAEWRHLLVPWGLWISPKEEIWACGSSPMIWEPAPALLGCPPKNQLFMRLDTTGRVQQLWTLPKGEDGKEKPGEVNWLHGIALDSQGNLYACDIMGKRVQKFVRHQP